jgi:glycerophosphoryl diester phosphodiesterase
LRDDGLAGAVVQVLQQVGRMPGRGAVTSDAGETTLVSSFDPLQLRRFWASTQTLPLGYLFYREQGAVMRNLWRRLRPMLRAVHPQAALIDAVEMRAWRAAGLLVNTWTVDDPHEIAALCTLGIDAIITNTPATVIAQLAAG